MYKWGVLEFLSPRERADNHFRAWLIRLCVCFYVHRPATAGRRGEDVSGGSREIASLHQFGFSETRTTAKEQKATAEGCFLGFFLQNNHAGRRLVCLTQGQSSKDEVAKPDSVCMNLEDKPSTSVLVFLAEALTEIDRNLSLICAKKAKETHGFTHVIRWGWTLSRFPRVCNQFWHIYEQNPWTKLGKETVQNGNIKTLFYCLQTTTVFFLLWFSLQPDL